MEPSRRRFIRGFLEATTATGLVIAANPDEILAFGRETKNVVLAAPEPAPDAPNLDYGMFLFDSEGRPVCIVDSVSIERNMIDTSTMDGVQTFTPGMHTVRLTGIVTGAFRMPVRNLKYHYDRS